MEIPLTEKQEQGSDPMYGTSACLGRTEAVPVLAGVREQEQRLHPCPCPCVGRGACVCVSVPVPRVSVLQPKLPRG